MACALVAAVGGSAAAAPAAARPVTVAIVGDSVAEGLHLPNAVEEAPAGALRAALRRRGHRATADGFRPANPHPQWLRWEGEWAYEGYRFEGHSPDGASGYTAIGRPGANASATVTGERVAILYTRAPDGGTFPVTIDGVRHELDGHAATPTVARTWLDLPRGRARVAVWAPPAGTLRFTGLLARSARDDVAVLGLGHGGRKAVEDVGPRNVAALEALAPDVTVLMFGIVEGLGVLWSSLDDPMGMLRRGLVARAAAAKRTGRCIVVPPAPSSLGAEVAAAVRAASRAAAEEAGCAFRPVLDGLWDVAGAQASGLLLGDGIHPTGPGYALLGRRLLDAVAPELPAATPVSRQADRRRRARSAPRRRRADRRRAAARRAAARRAAARARRDTARG